MNGRINSARGRKENTSIPLKESSVRNSCDKITQNRLFVTINPKKGRRQHPFAEETPYFSGKKLILETKVPRISSEFQDVSLPDRFNSRASSVSKRITKESVYSKIPIEEKKPTTNLFQKMMNNDSFLNITNKLKEGSQQKPQQPLVPYTMNRCPIENTIQAIPSQLSLSSSSIFPDEKPAATNWGRASSNHMNSQQSFFIRPAVDTSLRSSGVKNDSALWKAKKIALNKERVIFNANPNKNQPYSSREDIIAILQEKLHGGGGRIRNVIKREPTDSTIAESNYQDDWKNAEGKIESPDESMVQLNGKATGTIKLLKSIFQNRPSTIYFTYPEYIIKKSDKELTKRVVPLSQEDSDKYSAEIRAGKLPFCVSSAFQSAGFKFKGKGSLWNVYWGPVKTERIQKMNKYQKINHFPGCWQIGRKDNLYRHISRVKRKFPNDYDFIPQTYLLCSEYERFLGVQENAEKNSMWILKPCASSRGRGIKILNKNSDISSMENKKDYMVSVYISNPHLINGRKYDLRIYVLVSSFDPLRVYIYNEGLVRFASENYTLEKKDQKKRFVHLTNYSINKKSAKYKANNSATALGDISKWALTKYLEFMESQHGNSKNLWEGICDIVVKTCIAVEPNMLDGVNRLNEHKNNCFELYGFDILVDSNFKLWLMEVNVCPSLNSSSGLDKEIKGALICDIGNIIGCQPFDKKTLRDNFRDERSSLLGGVTQSREKVILKGEKNLNELRELNYDNYLEKLSFDDWNMLIESEEEFYRRGTFERIFPPSKLRSLQTYSGFFECQRLSNIILWRSLEMGKGFLETICKRNE